MIPGEAGGPAAAPFRRRLLAWYREHRRPLPWRADRDPYRIWVSEIMLQQTTVQAVVPYFEAWLGLFPDVETLARAPVRKILRAWQGLGYYERARNMRRAAKIILAKHGGSIPDDPGALRRLPGFGPYTTAAVLSLAFDKPFPVLDANVRRVAMRLLDLRGRPGPEADRKVSAWLEATCPRHGAGDFNQAMMELGALVCRPRSPLCLSCPVLDTCAAAAAGVQELIPPSKRTRLKKIEAVLAVVRKDGHVLIQKRAEKGLLAGLWEFPGGKREPGESRSAALRREVREELGAEVRSARFLTRVEHSYTRFQVTLYVYECRLDREPPAVRGRRVWSTLSGLRRYPLPSGSVKVVKFLEG
jgi:A/G-specific adenine glycosylase